MGTLYGSGRLIVGLLFVAAFLMTWSRAEAFSLTGRPTDDSVCDLSPLTSYYLGTKTFVQSGTRDAEVIYGRLALRAITQNCRNGQTLILDSEDGDAFDAKYFQDVANRVCVVGEVTRVSTGTAQYPQAFQIKCHVLKIQEARAWLLEAESAKSTESMIAEGAPKRSQTRASSTSESRSKDCGKPTWSSIFTGGGGCK